MGEDLEWAYLHKVVGVDSWLLPTDSCVNYYMHWGQWATEAKRLLDGNPRDKVEARRVLLSWALAAGTRAPVRELACEYDHACGSVPPNKEVT